MDDSVESLIPVLPLSLIDKKGKEKEGSAVQKRHSPNPKETLLSKVERRDVIDRKNKPPKMPLAIVHRDLSTLALHSPSSQIIGTPFALASTSTPFEYPFPETPPPSSASSASASASSSPPLYYNDNHSAFPLSISGPQRNHPLPLSFVHGPTSFPTNHHHHNTSSTPAFTANHNASRVNHHHHHHHHPYSKSPPQLLHTLGAHIQPSSYAHGHGHGHLASPPIPPSLVRKRAAAATSGRWNVRLRGDGSSRHSRSMSGEIHGDPTVLAVNPTEDEEEEEDNDDNLGLGHDDDDDDAGLHDRNSRCGTDVDGTGTFDFGRGCSSRRRQ